MLAKAFITTTALLSAAFAQQTPAAIVTIESSHGGAGQDLTNVTVTIPLTTAYTNHSALDTVSTLYLVDSVNSPINSITCTPFKNPDGSGDAGLAFDSTTPSYISTNTLPLGSIVCISSDISFAPPGPPPGGPQTLQSSLVVASSSGLVVATTFPSSYSELPHPDLTATTQTRHPTSVAQSSASESSSASPGASAGASASSSSPVAQATGNVASSLFFPGEVFGGLALAGFGLAFAL